LIYIIYSRNSSLIYFIKFKIFKLNMVKGIRRRGGGNRRGGRGRGIRGRGGREGGRR
jgi:hypothetical protein